MWANLVFHWGLVFPICWMLIIGLSLSYILWWTFWVVLLSKQNRQHKICMLSPTLFPPASLKVSHFDSWTSFFFSSQNNMAEKKVPQHLLCRGALCVLIVFSCQVQRWWVWRFVPQLVLVLSKPESVNSELRLYTTANLTLANQFRCLFLFCVWTSTVRQEKAMQTQEMRQSHTPHVTTTHVLLLW